MGYERNEDGCYVPHPEFFSRIKKVWEMRLDGKSFGEIMKWIRIAGIQRKTVRGNVFKMNKNTLTKIFKDPLYYGVLQQKDTMVDLRELYDFKPMVTFEEFEKCRKAGRSTVSVQARHNDPLIPSEEDSSAVRAASRASRTEGRGSTSICTAEPEGSAR